MAKKIVAVTSVILLSILAIMFVFESTSIDRDLLANTFEVKAIYFEQAGYVEISFSDNSDKTNSVVLEILGLSESFQKTYNISEFSERIPFSSEPQYGWKTNPVTFVIDHEEFGTIGIKTEIHAPNEPIPQIIFSKL